MPLLLYRLMEAQSASDGEGNPLAFTQHIARFPDEPRWQLNAIHVNLREPLRQGMTATVRLDYAGYLFGYSEVWQYVEADDASPARC